ncbi:outer membrane beta-barrel protein [Parabacteroides sp.]
MKSIWMIALFLFASLGAFGQKGEKSVGVNVGYGTASGFESFRLGAEFNWNATDHIRLSPSFDYYFAKYACYVVSADAHYLFPIKEKLRIYPLIGLTYTHFATNEFGGNFGAGVEYPILSFLNVSIEAKYQLTKDFKQFALAAFVSYKF